MLQVALSLLRVFCNLVKERLQDLPTNMNKTCCNDDCRQCGWVRLVCSSTDTDSALTRYL